MHSSARLLLVDLIVVLFRVPLLLFSHLYYVNFIVSDSCVSTLNLYIVHTSVQYSTKLTLDTVHHACTGKLICTSEILRIPPCKIYIKFMIVQIQYVRT